MRALLEYGHFAGAKAAGWNSGASASRLGHNHAGKLRGRHRVAAVVRLVDVAVPKAVDVDSAAVASLKRCKNFFMQSPSDEKFPRYFNNFRFINCIKSHEVWCQSLLREDESFNNARLRFLNDALRISAIKDSQKLMKIFLSVWNLPCFNEPFAVRSKQNKWPHHWPGDPQQLQSGALYKLRSLHV